MEDLSHHLQSELSHRQELEKTLIGILDLSRVSLESADNITFGNKHVKKMKECNHQITKKVAESLALLGKIEKR